MRRPNILLVMSDQEQHWDLLPPELHRPGLEELLETGVRFSRHHVVALPCGPSRSALYTGQHTDHTGLHLNPSRARGIEMSSDVPTVGGMLREHGYHTAYKGKWHVSVVDPPEPFRSNTVHALEDYGFADYNPDGDPVGVGWDGFRQDPSVAASAAAWIRGEGTSRPDDRPWFLAVNFVNPHDVMFLDATGSMNRTGTSAAPRLPVPRTGVYTRDWDVELPVSFHDDWSSKPAAQAAVGEFVRAYLGDIPRDDEHSWRRLRSYYYNCLRDLDGNVRLVLDALRESGHDRDTVVLYTTDHGEAAGAHGHREKPTSMYREVVNVPLVVRHPDVAGGTSVGGVTSAVDLAPTVLGLAGVAEGERRERHPQLRGLDLGPAVADAGLEPRADRGMLMSMQLPPLARPGSADGAGVARGRRCLRALVERRWKLARYSTVEDFAVNRVEDVLGPASDLELYDTAADPHELTDLSTDPAHRPELERLARRLVDAVAAEIGT